MRRAGRRRSKAIITNCATDDRYADDIHYMGGALLTEQEMWSNFMLVKKAMAPDPQIVGDAWRAMWESRLAATRSLSEIWLAHQRRDDYWRQGSVCENHAAIECAVMAVCGWEDSYSNFVPRLLEHLPGPKLGIVGPWSHAYPCRGAPGPLIGYLQEALRWWRHWLVRRRHRHHGRAALPRLDHRRGAAATFLSARSCRVSWAAEDAWPSPRIERRTLHLNAAGLGSEAAPGATLSVRSPATAGRDCGRWGGYGGCCPDMAIDQRREDGLALCFDTPPLDDDLTLLGAPELDLLVTVDQPHVNLAARLCDVYPDGTSALMTYGVLNLSHRDSHEHPTPCPVGTPFRVRLKLNDFARTIPKGHRIRLALANQHWPILWPQPKLSTLSVATGDSTVMLPVRPPSPRDRDVRFEPAETAPPVPTTTLDDGFDRRIVTDDVGSGCADHRADLRPWPQALRRSRHHRVLGQQRHDEHPRRRSAVGEARHRVSLGHRQRRGRHRGDGAHRTDGRRDAFQPELAARGARTGQARPQRLGNAAHQARFRLREAGRRPCSHMQ